MNHPDAVRMGLPADPTISENFNSDHPIIDPSYRGLWIPLELLRAKDITRVERDLASMIFALMENKGGTCFASNKYLGERMGCSEKTIANTLIPLKKKGYVKQISWDGRKRHLITILPIP